MEGVLYYGSCVIVGKGSNIHPLLEVVTFSIYNLASRPINQKTRPRSFLFNASRKVVTLMKIVLIKEVILQWAVGACERSPRMRTPGVVLKHARL
jgi:hypothetical protein